MAKRRLEEEDELATEEGDLGTSVGEGGPDEIRDLEEKSLERIGIVVQRKGRGEEQEFVEKAGASTVVQW